MDNEVETPGRESLFTARDDAGVYHSFLAADEAASVAHDFIWGLNGVTKEQASDAIHTVHAALRPFIVLEGDDVAGDLEGKLRNEDDAALRNYLAKPKGIDD
jgi:hypothetical protein